MIADIAGIAVIGKQHPVCAQISFLLLLFFETRNLKLETLAKPLMTSGLGLSPA